MKLFRKILWITLSAAAVAGVILLMGFANDNHQNSRCKDVQIKITSLGSEELLTTQIIKDQLTKNFGKLQEQKLKSIRVEEIQKFLKQNPYIDDATAKVSLNGELQVAIRQSRPIVRVFNTAGNNFYLDEKGKMMPASIDFPIRVLVASGSIEGDFKPGKNIFKLPKTEKEKNASLYKVYNLAKTIDADTTAKALIEQCFVDPKGKIGLVTKVGKHQVILGDTSDCQNKISNLITFYRYGLPKLGWDTYKSINLTYKNQVVCIK